MNRFDLNKLDPLPGGFKALSARVHTDHFNRELKSLITPAKPEPKPLGGDLWDLDGKLAYAPRDPKMDEDDLAMLRRDQDPEDKAAEEVRLVQYNRIVKLDPDRWLISSQKAVTESYVDGMKQSMEAQLRQMAQALCGLKREVDSQWRPYTPPHWVTMSGSTHCHAGAPSEVGCGRNVDLKMANGQELTNVYPGSYNWGRDCSGHHVISWRYAQ